MLRLFSDERRTVKKKIYRFYVSTFWCVLIFLINYFFFGSSLLRKQTLNKSWLVSSLRDKQHSSSRLPQLLVQLFFEVNSLNANLILVEFRRELEFPS